MLRTLLMVVVIAGLGAWGWWMSTNRAEAARERELARVEVEDDAPPMELSPAAPAAEALSAPPIRVVEEPDASALSEQAAQAAAETRPLMVSTWTLDAEPLTGVQISIRPDGSLETIQVTTADVDGEALAVARVPLAGGLSLEGARDGWFQLAQDLGAGFVPTGPRGRANADTHEVHLGFDRALTLHVEVVAEVDGKPVSHADVDVRLFGEPYGAFGGMFHEMFGGGDHVALGRSTDGAGRVSFTVPGRGWTHAEVDVSADGLDPADNRRVELSLAEAGVHVERVALSGDPGLVHVSAVALAESGPVAGLQMIAGRVVASAQPGVAHVERIWRGPTDAQGRFGFHAVPGPAHERVVLRTAGAPWRSVGSLGPLSWTELTGSTQVVPLGVPVIDLPIRVHGTVPGGRYFVDWAPVVDGLALTGAGSRSVLNNGDVPLDSVIQVPAVGSVRLAMRHMFAGSDADGPPAVIIDTAAPPEIVEFQAPRLLYVDGVVALPPDLPEAGKVQIEFALDRQVLVQEPVARDGLFAASGLAPGRYDVEVWHWRPGHNRIVVGYWRLDVDNHMSGLVFDQGNLAGERRPR